MTVPQAADCPTCGHETDPDPFCATCHGVGYIGPGRPRVVNIARGEWVEHGRRAAFTASRPAYGIEVAPGAFVSFNRTRPSVWERRAIAQTIADTTDLSGVPTVAVS